MGAARRLLLAACATVVACAGCFLVTGSTDGYVPRDAQGSDAAADTANGLSLDCISAADCAGDAGPLVCCLSLSSLTSAATSCQASPCTGSLSAQLCQTDTECADAGCIAQQCSFAGSSVNVRACGAVFGCTAQ